MYRKIIAVFMGSAAVWGLASCSSKQNGVETTDFGTTSQAIIIDVRTPEEYQAGHLEGAVLLDYSSGEFLAELPLLDPRGNYFIYCRSGNRSHAASELMRQAQFQSVTDLGSMDSAARTTGLHIVTD